MYDLATKLIDAGLLVWQRWPITSIRVGKQSVEDRRQADATQAFAARRAIASGNYRLAEGYLQFIKDTALKQTLKVEIVCAAAQETNTLQGQVTGE